jgi:hypothetical protein
MDEWRHLRLRRAPEVELAAEADVFTLEFLEFIGDSSGGRERLDLLGSKAEDRLELCHILLELGARIRILIAGTTAGTADSRGILVRYKPYALLDGEPGRGHSWSEQDPRVTGQCG